MFKRVVLLAGVLLIAAQTARVEAGRGDIVPVSGTVGVLHTSLTGVTAITVDDQNQRVYVASRADNTILALDFLGNRTAIRTTFAQPSALAVGGGAAFALLSGTGQVVRLDPATLAPTVLASGLVEASGLAYTNGYLYVFSRVTSYQIRLKRIDAVSAAITDTPVITSDSSFELYASAQHPGIVFGTRPFISPGGIHRWDLATGELTYRHESPGRMTFLPDGQLLTSSGISDQPAGISARDPLTLESSGRLWRMTDPSIVEPVTWASTQSTVALGRESVVQLASITNPAQVYRTYRFLDFTDYWGPRVALTADSSRLFVVGTYNGIVDIYAVPGVGASSAPSAPNPAGGSVRGAAPGAQGANQSRTGAPQVNGSPPWVMKSVTDIEFAADGAVYVSDPINGVVDQFAPDGTPIHGWRYLGGVESLAELNGALYATVPREGSVARIDATRADAARVATGITGISGLTPANGKLWTTYYRQLYTSKVASVDPGTGTVWRQPDVYGNGFYWEAVSLAEQPVAGHLLGYWPYGPLRFNFNSLSFVQDQLSLSPPFAVSPDGLTVIDGDGKRLTTTPFAPDGFVFPGSGHTISGANASGRKLVAARSNTLGISLVVYDETNPGDIVYSEPTLTNYTVGRIEFRPGTTELWVSLTAGTAGNSPGQAFVIPINVGPAPYTAEIGDDSDIDLAAVFPTARLAAAIAAQTGSAGAYVDPGKPEAGPKVPTTVVDLSPASVFHPDPASPPVTVVAAASEPARTSASGPKTNPSSISTPGNASVGSAPAGAAPVSAARVPAAPTTRVAVSRRTRARRSASTTKPRWRATVKRLATPPVTKPRSSR